MAGEIQIGIDDRDAAEEIMAKAYRILGKMPALNLAGVSFKTPETIYLSGSCPEASDAVTRSAHELHVVASRERHPFGSHHITSFGPLDQPPGENDPIMCLTLGQFKPRGFKGTSFFGRRGDLVRYFPPHSSYTYQGAFGASQVLLRQITHAPYPEGAPEEYHRWLPTTPEALAAGDYPMGEVSPEVFEDLLADMG